jgi:hypothetical protein
MEHLFISYATEDAALARWLTLKLTVEGYKVWCFEFQMLGGESFPREIDQAIKAQTFRMLALVSHHSVKKANPVKEWTLAQAIGAERKVDFLIPINVDGVTPTELPWTLSDTNWISFSSLGWAGGFKQLLKLLQKLNAPKPIQNGAAITAETFLSDGIVSGKSETLFSNSIKFKSVPPRVKAYRLMRTCTTDEWWHLRSNWAFWRIEGKSIFLAFSPPPDELLNGLLESTGQEWEWSTTENIEGIPSHNLVSSILYRSVVVILLAGGCKFWEENRALYFPDGLFPKNKLSFKGYGGRGTYIATKGKSTFYRRGQAQVCNYFLGFRHSVIRSPSGTWMVYFKIYLRLTNEADNELEPRPAMSRRKAITRGWWNDKLLNRYLALCSAVRGFQDLRRFREGNDQVLLEETLISFSSPGGIDESQLDGERASDSPSAVEDGSQEVVHFVPSQFDEEEEVGNEP